MTRNTITETGCYLDSHRGHYITRDMIDLAVDMGFIVDPFTQYALDHYESWYATDDGIMSQCLYDLAEAALYWLNVGDNSGLEREIKGQNSPPIIPDGYAWEWNDGDFGLYPGYEVN